MSYTGLPADMPIDDLHEQQQLSIRARRVIDKLGCKTAGDVAANDEIAIMAVNGCGVTTLNEIKRKLGYIGLSLRENEKPQDEVLPEADVKQWRATPQDSKARQKQIEACRSIEAVLLEVADLDKRNAVLVLRTALLMLGE